MLAILLFPNIPSWLRRVLCGFAWAVMGGLLGGAGVLLVWWLFDPIPEDERGKRFGLFALYAFLFWAAVWVPFVVIPWLRSRPGEKRPGLRRPVMVLVAVAMVFFFYPKFETLPYEDFAGTMAIVGPIAWGPFGALIARREEVWQRTGRGIRLGAILGAIAGAGYGVFGYMVTGLWAHGIIAAVALAPFMVLFCAVPFAVAGALVGCWLGSLIGLFCTAR
jgi:hypothetical protein